MYETALVSLPGKIKWKVASGILGMEKSRGLKKATNVGKARYGGPPNKEHTGARKDTKQWRKGRKHSGETQDTVDSGERNKTQWRKSRGLKKATNVGRGRYGGPPNKEGDFQANRTLQIGLIHTLHMHLQDPSRFLMKIKGSKLLLGDIPQVLINPRKTAAVHWWQSGLLSLVNIKSAHSPLPLPYDTLVTGMSIRALEVGYRVASTSVGSFSEDDKLLLHVS